jgi:CheY-like chemotaxis protein
MKKTARKAAIVLLGTIPLSAIGAARSAFALVYEEQIGALMRIRLEKLGYRVTVQQPDNFDLIITDQTMPCLTGSQLAQEILRIRPGIPVIRLQASAKAQQQRRHGALGSVSLSKNLSTSMNLARLSTAWFICHDIVN